MSTYLIVWITAQSLETLVCLDVPKLHQCVFRCADHTVVRKEHIGDSCSVAGEASLDGLRDNVQDDDLGVLKFTDTLDLFVTQRVQKSRSHTHIAVTRK